MGIILISSVPVTTGYTASALYGSGKTASPWCENSGRGNPLSGHVLSPDEARIPRFGLLYPFY